MVASWTSPKTDDLYMKDENLRSIKWPTYAGPRMGTNCHLMIPRVTREHCGFFNVPLEGCTVTYRYRGLFWNSNFWRTSTLSLSLSRLCSISLSYYIHSQFVINKTRWWLISFYLSYLQTISTTRRYRTYCSKYIYIYIFTEAQWLRIMWLIISNSNFFSKIIN
jgi:hypothetical protein